MEVACGTRGLIGELNPHYLAKVSSLMIAFFSSN